MNKDSQKWSEIEYVLDMSDELDILPSKKDESKVTDKISQDLAKTIERDMMIALFGGLK